MDTKHDLKIPASGKPCTAPGRLFLISGPSGVGKTTLRMAVLDEFKEMRYSISHTTRLPRKRERHGVDYFFITKATFLEEINKNQWAEWANVHGWYYGTSAKFINENISLGYDTLLDIDVQGTKKILGRYPACITVFILPPSMDALKARLENRRTDDQETIRQRLAEAENEMRYKDQYCHVVVNDRLSHATAHLIDIIRKYHSC